MVIEGRPKDTASLPDFAALVVDRPNIPSKFVPVLKRAMAFHSSALNPGGDNITC